MRIIQMRGELVVDYALEDLGKVAKDGDRAEIGERQGGFLFWK